MGGGVRGSGGEGVGLRGIRVDVNEELKFWGKVKKNGGGGRGGRWEGSGWGGVRVDLIEELKFLGNFTKKKFGGGGGGRVGGQGGCERRIEVFVKIQKKMGGVWWVGGRGRVGGVRMDVIVELKFLEKFKKKIIGGGRIGGGGRGGWSGWWGGSGWM